MRAVQRSGSSFSSAVVSGPGAVVEGSGEALGGGTEPGPGSATDEVLDGSEVVVLGDAAGSSEQAGSIAPSTTASTSDGSGRSLTAPSSHRDHPRIGHDGWDPTREEAMRVVDDYDLCESNAI